MRQPDWQTEDGAVRLYCGDCREVLPTMPENHYHSCVTDPPYELGFMGRAWDRSGVAFLPETWKEVYRVLRPGAHLLAFGGSRTFHRLACAIEDAGFEIRDDILELFSSTPYAEDFLGSLTAEQVKLFDRAFPGIGLMAWGYGSGFPKALNVSKAIDQQERSRWLDVVKALDNLNVSEIIDAWKEYSNTASDAGTSFPRSQREAGLLTPKCDSVAESVLLKCNPENSCAAAIAAELSSREAHRTLKAVARSALSSAGESERTGRAKSAASKRTSDHARFSIIGIARFDAKDWQNESQASRLKAAEALRTWLGSARSSRQETTSALCAALADDLRRIILSRSRTFQNFDTTQQMDCASAISATITESTAASLISFTAATLRSKAIDKAAGAEREVIGRTIAPRKAMDASEDAKYGYKVGEIDITLPATEAAKQWDGWASALKPAFEPIILARKPLDGTIAANVLKWGCGALNIGASRVGTEVVTTNAKGPGESFTHITGFRGCEESTRQGRYPANVLHDGSPEVVGMFPSPHGAGYQTEGDHCGGSQAGHRNEPGGFQYGAAAPRFGDSGSAARFFWSPKASKDERPEHTTDDGRTVRHPTVKPLELIRYLVRLITPPGGRILEPFTGSGTTLEAAWLGHWRCDGIELDAEHVPLIASRMTERIAELPLFEKPAPKIVQRTLLD